MSFYSKLYKSVTVYYENIQEQYSIKYLKEALISILFIICLVGGFFLNKFYVQNREQQAFIALSEVVDSFMQSQRSVQAMNMEKDKEKIEQAWSDTQILLEALYKEHINSYLAPYFLVFKSQIILERDHNLDEAIKVLDEALQYISRKTELGSLYHMKRIKMGFDSKNSEIKEKALKDLLEITKNPKEYAYQEALYLLGIYYISQGAQDKSLETFKTLVASADEKALIKSPWVILAQEKLGLSSLPTDGELK